MLTLWKELKKIIRQIRGSHNIFGYKSVVANQMYLFYCFCGKIYFTDKMDKGIKHLWYILVSSELAISYIFTLAYFLYDKEHDIIIMLNAVNAVSTINVTCFGLALMSFICDDQIEAIIKQIDLILTSKRDDQLANSKHSRNNLDVKSKFVSFVGPFMIAGVIYMFICFFDVAMFFSEDKAKNNFYYMSPVPLIWLQGTFASFLFFNSIVTFAFGMFMVKLISFFGVAFYWNTICCYELIDIRDEFDRRSCNLMKDMEKGAGLSRNFEEWNNDFHGIVQNGIGRFRDVLLLINYLKIFMEVIGTFVTPLTFFYGIAVLYICLSENLVFVLLLKYVTATFGCIFSAFIFYWAGQNLENSIIEVSTAVYSTPWYCSVEVRKNVHLLLCQTQSVRNFSIINVYGLLLKNFARYLNGVMTYTNLLRRLTLK